MPEFRYVAVDPERIEHRELLGAASFLHEFLVHYQTDPEGNVWFGKAIGYAWIRSKWKAAPPIRTLKFQMALLRRHGFVQVRVVRGRGMTLRVLGSVKWKPLPRQLPLFPLPEPLSISGARAYGKAVKFTNPQGQPIAPVGGNPLPPKEVKKLVEETRYAAAPARVGGVAVKNSGKLSELRAELARLESRLAAHAADPGLPDTHLDADALEAIRDQVRRTQYQIDDEIQNLRAGKPKPELVPAIPPTHPAPVRFEEMLRPDVEIVSASIKDADEGRLQFLEALRTLARAKAV